MYLISLFSGIYFCSVYSYLFFRRLDLNEFFVTLFVITSPIPLLAYSNSFLVKYYLYFLFIFSIFYQIYLFLKSLFNGKIKLKKLLKINKFDFIYRIKEYLIINKFIIFFTLLITFYISYKILPFQWRFENHDLLYFSWVNDIFDISYKGPIRLSIAYPNELSAMNLQSGSYLTPFLIFAKNNIFFTYTTKFFLLIVSQFYLIYILLKKIFSNYCSRWQHILFSIPFVGILFFLTFYSFEINYSQSISNYGLLIYILNLASLCIRFSSTKKETDQIYFISQLILNIICLTSFKATTFPTFIFSFIVFSFILNNQTSKNLIYKSIRNNYFLIFSLPFISLLGWLSQKSNHGYISSIFPICLKDDIALCTYSFFRNPFQGWWPQEDLRFYLLRNNLTDSIIGIYEYIYIWFIVIVPSLIFSYYLIKKTNNLGFKIFGYFNISYVFSAIFSILFIRESLSFRGIHVSHSYLIIPFFTIASYCLILVTKDLEVIKNIKIKLLILLLIVSFVIFNHFNDSVNKGRVDNIKTFNSSDSISMTFNESKKFYSTKNSVCTNDKDMKDKFTSNHIDINGCGDNEIKTLYSALKGLRSKSGAYNILLKKFLINN